MKRAGWFRGTAFAIAALTLSSSAVSANSYYSAQKRLSDLQLCKTERSREAQSNAQFRNDVIRDLQARGVTPQRCDELIRQQKAAIAAALAVGAAAAIIASEGGGGSSGSSTTAGSYAAQQDYDWDWDQFYNQYGQLVWACRGVQTGQFAEFENCRLDAKIDSRWPGPYWRD
jgi:hypothetical protein